MDVCVPVSDVSVALTWQIRQNMHYDPKLSAFCFLLEALNFHLEIQIIAAPVWSRRRKQTAFFSLNNCDVGDSKIKGCPSEHEHCNTRANLIAQMQK